MTEHRTTTRRRPTPALSSSSGRPVPRGLAAGSGFLLFAWAATYAMARLTGAVSLVILLGAGAVGGLAATVTGWWCLRRIDVVSVDAHPSLVTTGDTLRLTLAFDARASASPVHVAIVDRGEEIGRGWVHHDRLTVDAVVMRRGVIDSLELRLGSAGRAGICWWRRSTTVACEPIDIAPRAEPPGLLVTAAAARQVHTTTRTILATRSPALDGELDGVRPWREGDADHAVHWPTSLRTGTLTVFDHRGAGADDVVVRASSAAPDPDAEAARARWSIEERLRRGDVVSAAVDDAEPMPVPDATAAARWSARCLPTSDEQPARRSSSWSWSSSRPWSSSQSWSRSRSRSAEPDEVLTAGARWWVALTSVIALLMLTAALGSGPATVVTLVGGCVLTAAMTSGGTTSRLLRLTVHGLVTAFTVVGLLAVVRTVSTSNDLLDVITGPLPQVLMLLVVLHGFECTRRRAARAALGFSAVVTAYAAGQRIDPAFAAWLLAWGLAFIVTIRAVAAPRTPPVEPDDSGGIATGRFTGRFTGRWNGRSSARTGVRTTVTAAAGVIATVLVLSTVTVPSGPARLGLPSSLDDIRRVEFPGAIADGSGRTTDGATGRDTTSRTGSVGGYPGFDHTLDTSLRGDMGDDIVLRVRSPEPDFWRGQTFSTFDGRRWTVDDDPGTWLRGPDVVIEPAFGDVRDPAIAPTRELLQTYYVEFDLPNMIFAASRPERVLVEGDVFARSDGALRTDVVLTAGAVYTVVSERTLVTPQVLARQGRIDERLTELGRDAFARHLEVPVSTTERTIALADELAAGTSNTYEMVRAMEAWIAANVQYDLDAPVPDEGVDAVDDLLFGGRRGFCEQIASALAIMLRTQGIPTRLATGYVPGTRNRVSGVWEVRASDAHAWVEVWFPETGWQAFDPTADVPLAGESARPTVGGDLVRALGDVVTRHGRTIVVWALSVLTAIALVAVAVRSAMRIRHARRRGRWGLLHDRWVRAAATLGIDDQCTHPERARRWALQRPDLATGLAALASELDRVAFDPEWSDDDEAHARMVALMTELERTRPAHREPADPEPGDPGDVRERVGAGV